jgi:hypothetical protein
VNGGLAGASVGGETSASASCEGMDRESDQRRGNSAGETAWFGARPRVRRDLHPAVVRLPERRSGGRGTGATKRARGQRARGSRPPDPTKGPYRWKASRTEGSVAFYEAAWRAVSAAHSPEGPAGAPKRSQADTRKRLHARRRVRPRARVGGDRDVRGSVASGTMGRKRPCPRARSVTASAWDAPRSGKRVR